MSSNLIVATMRYIKEVRKDPQKVFKQQQYAYIIKDTLTGREVNAVSTERRAEEILRIRNRG